MISIHFHFTLQHAITFPLQADTAHSVRSIFLSVGKKWTQFVVNSCSCYLKACSQIPAVLNVFTHSVMLYERKCTGCQGRGRGHGSIYTLLHSGCWYLVTLPGGANVAVTTNELFLSFIITMSSTEFWRGAVLNNVEAHKLKIMWISMRWISKQAKAGNLFYIHKCE